MALSCAALGGLLCLRLELCCDHFPDIIDCQGDVRRVLVDQHLRKLPLHSICLISQEAQSRELYVILLSGHQNATSQTKSFFISQMSLRAA